MVSKKALEILRRMEIAVDANAYEVAKSLEKDLYAELGYAEAAGKVEGDARRSA